MLKRLWLALILFALLYGIYNERFTAVLLAIPHALSGSVPFIFTLALFISLWMGVLRLAEGAGLVLWLARRFNKPMQWLFPEIPAEHPAQHAILMNLSANTLGLNNAATPLGLKAMHYLQKLNQHSSKASHSMCTLLVLNTSSLQVIPASTLAFLMAAGASHPMRLILPTLFATSCSTLGAIVAVKGIQIWGARAWKETPSC